jgi:hypothetical protein
MDDDAAAEFGGEDDDFGLSDVEDYEFAEGEERLERRLAAEQLKEELAGRETENFGDSTVVVNADGPTERRPVGELPAQTCPICDASLGGLTHHVCFITLGLDGSDGSVSYMLSCCPGCRIARKPLFRWHAVAVASPVFYQTRINRRAGQFVPGARGPAAHQACQARTS